LKLIRDSTTAPQRANPQKIPDSVELRPGIEPGLISPTDCFSNAASRARVMGGS